MLERTLIMKTKYNIYLMYIITLLQGMVFYSSISTLYRQSQGMTLVQMGIIESVFSVLIFIFEIPWGYICDRIGYKKTLIICYGIYMISKIIFWKAHCFSMFLLERILLAVVVSGLSGCDTAFIYMSTKGKNSTHIFGIYQALGTLGLIISSTIYSLFIKEQYQLAGFLTVIPYTIAFVLSLFLKDVEYQQEDKTNIKIKDISTLFPKKHILLFIISATLLTETTHTLSIFYNQLQYQKVGIPISYYGILYSFMTLLALSSGFIGKILNHVKEESVLYMIYILSLTACLLMSFSQSIPLTILSIAILYISEALFYPMMYTKYNQSVKTSRALTLSMYSMLMNITAFFTNLSFGYFADIDVQFAILLGAVLILIAFLCFYTYNKKDKVR